MRNPRREMTIEQFAELADLPVSEIEAYRDVGLLDPDRNGAFDEKDVFRMQVIQIHRDRGLDAEEIAERIKSSNLSSLLRIFGGGHYSVEEASKVVGIPPEKLVELGTSSGLGWSSWDDNDVEAMRGIKAMIDAGLPWQAMVDGARVYGDALRRIAEAGVRMMHRYLCKELEAQGKSGAELGVALFEAVDVIHPTTKRLIEHVYMDHLLSAAIDHALLHLEEDQGGTKDDAATIVFIDLALYTALTQAHGDEVAAEVLDRFDAIVRRLVLKNAGTLVKQSGDAFMLVFLDPAESLRFAVEVSSEIADEPDFPELRVGIHHGPVLYRVGDYVGHTVNVASRVSAMASAGSVLVTEPVAAAAERAGVDVEEAGVRRARGVDEPLKLFRLKTRRLAAATNDPVCGIAVSGGGVGSVKHDGVEYIFHSRDCMKKFLDEPTRYLAAS